MEINGHACACLSPMHARMFTRRTGTIDIILTSYIHYENGVRPSYSDGLTIQDYS